MEDQQLKKIIIFDLDGTLAESKSALDDEMSQLFAELLRRKLVAVMSGGFFPQFEKQLLCRLSDTHDLFSNLYLFPTSGACFYRYQLRTWSLAYAHNLEDVEKQKIFKAFENAFRDISYEHPRQIFGEMLEDRETQVTFSALGQGAPVSEKEQWNRTKDSRLRIKNALEQHLPEFEIRLGGLTSIDVTRKGIDKAYGIRQIEKFLNIPKKDMLFVGDALYEGGNDYPVIREGVESISVNGPEDTKKLIQSML